jgi:NADP-dependent 3-hydroxy acid dehydrogenase YdfG
MDEQDAGITEDNIRLIKTTVDELGGLDIIIANAGWTKFSKFGDINELTHADWNKVRLIVGVDPTYRLVLTKVIVVLGNKCYVTSCIDAAGRADFQCKSRWWSVFDILIDRSTLC